MCNLSQSGTIIQYLWAKSSPTLLCSPKRVFLSRLIPVITLQVTLLHALFSDILQHKSCFTTNLLGKGSVPCEAVSHWHSPLHLYSDPF